MTENSPEERTGCNKMIIFIPMKKLAAFFLSLLVLAPGLKPGMVQHICQGEIAEVRLFSGYGTASCGMRSRLCVAGKHLQGFDEASCCQDFVFLAFDQDVTYRYSSLYSPSDFLPAEINHFTRAVYPDKPVALALCYLPPPLLAEVDLAVIGVFIL